MGETDDDIEKLLEDLPLRSVRARRRTALAVAVPVLVVGGTLVFLSSVVAAKQRALRDLQTRRESLETNIATLENERASKQATVDDLRRQQRELTSELTAAKDKSRSVIVASREDDEAVRKLLAEAPRASYVSAGKVFDVQLWLDEGHVSAAHVTSVRYELDPIWYPRTKLKVPTSPAEKVGFTAVGVCRSRVRVVLATASGATTEVAFDWCEKRAEETEVQDAKRR